MASFKSRQPFGYNKFNRSHRHFTSCNMAQVIPIRISEVVPGETLSRNIDAFARMLPLQNPAFLDADLEIAHYFVSRNAIDPFYSIRVQEFEGENVNSQLPYINIRKSSSLYKEFFSVGSLGDYLGMCFDKVDVNVPSFDVALYPFVAYHMIIDRFYRDPHTYDVERTRKFMRQILSSTGVTRTTLEAIAQYFGVSMDGTAPSSEAVLNDFFSVARCNWLPDYFSTARPTQNGNSLPIPGMSDIFSVFQEGIGGTDFSSSLVATFGEALPSVPTIPALWDAELLQKVGTMLERGGFSYFDFMKTLYGVDLSASEYESEYPVYLGGSSRPLSIDAVEQSAPSASSELGSGVGTQAGQGSAYNSDNGFSRRFSKAGFVISVAVIRPQVAYLSGIHPMFNRLKLGADLIPQLADLSDQPIQLRELSGDYSLVNGQYVFGYTDRYNEYRTAFNRASGKLRTTESSWLVSRKNPYGTISADWQLARPNYNPWQVTDESVDHFFLRCHVQESAVLPLPVKSAPYVW